MYGYVNEVDSGFITDEEYHSYHEGWQDKQELRLAQTPIYDGLDIFNTLSNEVKINCLAEPMNNACNTALTISSSKNTTNDNEQKFRRYFGRQCRCHETLTYMDELMYCHCLASSEALDEKLQFRDSLLLKLLKMESKFWFLSEEQKQQKQKQKPQPKGVEMALKHKRYKEEIIMNNFQFKYSTIYQDEGLVAMAHKTVSQSSDPKTNLRRLFVNTFQHLRNDGIVYLIDVEHDIYILLSKTRVLIPTMQKIIAQEEQYRFSKKMRLESNNNNKVNNHSTATIPLYLSNIHPQKYRLLKSIVERQRNQE